MTSRVLTAEIVLLLHMVRRREAGEEISCAKTWETSHLQLHFAPRILTFSTSTWAFYFLVLSESSPRMKLERIYVINVVWLTDMCSWFWMLLFVTKLMDLSNVLVTVRLRRYNYKKIYKYCMNSFWNINIVKLFKPRLRNVRVHL